MYPQDKGKKKKMDLYTYKEMRKKAPALLKKMLKSGNFSEDEIEDVMNFIITLRGIIQNNNDDEKKNLIYGLNLEIKEIEEEYVKRM